MEDLKSKAGDQLRELFGEDAFYDDLEDVVRQYRERFAGAAPSLPRDPSSPEVGRSA